MAKGDDIVVLADARSSLAAAGRINPKIADIRHIDPRQACTVLIFADRINSTTATEP